MARGNEPLDGPSAESFLGIRPGSVSQWPKGQRGCRRNRAVGRIAPSLWSVETLVPR